MKHLSSEPKRSCWVSVGDKGAPGGERSGEDGGPGSGSHKSPQPLITKRLERIPNAQVRTQRSGTAVSPTATWASRVPTSLPAGPDGQRSLEAELLTGAGDRCYGGSQDQVLCVPGEAEALHGGKRCTEAVGEASQRGVPKRAPHTPAVVPTGHPVCGGPVSSKMGGSGPPGAEQAGGFGHPAPELLREPRGAGGPPGGQRAPSGPGPASPGCCPRADWGAPGAGGGGEPGPPEQAGYPAPSLCPCRELGTG